MFICSTGQDEYITHKRFQEMFCPNMYVAVSIVHRRVLCIIYGFGMDGGRLHTTFLGKVCLGNV